MKNSDAKGRPRLWRVLMVAVAFVFLCVLALVVLALLGPTIGSLLRIMDQDLADAGQCAEAANALPDIESGLTVSAALDAWDLSPASETLTADNAALAVELETFQVKEPSLSQKIVFEDTGKLLLIEDSNWRANPVALSPDGKTLLLVEGRPSDSAIVRVCAVDTGDQRDVFTADETTRAVAWTPDGERFILNEGQGTILTLDGATASRSDRWDVRARGEQWRVTSHMAISPNGQLAVFTVADSDFEGPSIRIWDIDSGVELASLHGHSDTIISLGFDPNGTRLASNSMDGTVRVWGLPKD